MKKTLFLLGLSLLSIEGMADTGSVILYGKPNQTVTCVSPNGKWACGVQGTGASSLIGFVWNLESGEQTPLGTGSQAYAVSDNGIVAGLFPSSDASSNGATVSSAGYWQDGSWHSLGGGNSQFPGISIAGGQASSVSADGRYIGGMLYINGVATPVVWKDGEIVNVLNDGYAGEVTAIASDGSVFGGWGYTEQSGGTRQPLLWAADGQATALPGSLYNPFQTICDFTSDGKHALWIGVVGSSTIGIRDMEAGTDRAIPYYSGDNDSEVYYDITDDLSAVGYEQTPTAAYPIIYNYAHNKTTLLETYLTDKGVDFAADGIIAPRSDGAQGMKWNLLRGMAVSKDGQTFGIQAATKDMYEIPIIVKLGLNATNPAPAGVKVSMMSGLKVAKVQWAEPLLGASSVQGYNVYRNGEKVTPEPVDGTAFYDGTIVGGATYSYEVEAVYAGNVVSEKSEAAQAVIPAFAPNAPRQLMARMKGAADVMLSWMEPQRNQPTLQYYGDTDEVSGFGGGYYSFEAAIRYDASDMAAYNGYNITAVKFCPRKEIESWKINIYSGQQLVRSVDVDQQGLQFGRVNTVALAEPLPVPADGDLYVAVQANVASTETSSDILGLIYDKATFGYSDLVRMVGETDGSGDPRWFYSLEDDAEQSGGTSYPVTFVIGAELAPASGGDAYGDLTQYGVYRDGEPIGTAQATSFVDEGVADGEHTYAVEAQYAGGDKSAQASVDFTAAAAYKPISQVSVAAGATPQQVTFSWSAPLNNDATNLQYCGEAAAGGVTGYEDNLYGYEARATFIPSRLASYGGYTVRALRFYPLASAEFTFTVMKDGEVIAEQYVDSYETGKWNTVALDEPFVIDDKSTYTLSLDCYDVVAGQPALAYDGQAAFSGLGDIVSMDAGTTYTTIPGVYLDETNRGNWLIGMVADDGTDKPMAIDGYEVRVDAKPVTSQPITETTYTHDFGTGASASSTHRVNVDVIYSVKGKVEGTGVFFTLDEVTAIADNVVNELKIAHDGPSYIRVEGEGVSGLEVYSLGGALVASSASNVVSVQGVQGGMYILKVKTAAGEKTCKVRVVR